MRNIRLTIAYDGTAYHGWQRQKSGVVTVQGTIESALARIVNHPVDLVGAGRTDAGVHALGQTGNFFTESAMPAERLMRALNSRLPTDIGIRRSVEAPADFHATKSAISKLYRYTIHNSSQPPVQGANR